MHRRGTGKGPGGQRLGRKIGEALSLGIYLVFLAMFGTSWW